ncbi:adenosylmethionine decarboxylase [Marinicella sp. W31]|uniref:adenosylmethionine decarboxylase n=1 Tax=Marinicella sp. W31 TaxID=3023713 RepID=UPI0037569F1A
MSKSNIIEAKDILANQHTSVQSNQWPEFTQDANDDRQDHFIVRGDKVFAGTHLIIDLWGAKNLDDLAIMEQAMREAVEKAKATLLHIHLHHFTPNGGISGVAVLAESHISVHTWPERNYAAFDVFMCGHAEPEQAILVFNKYFEPHNYDVKTILRGEIS